MKPSDRFFEIEAAPQDFGQVFASWGWHPSTFVVLPIYGPNTIRDGVGLIPDAALDPATYFFPAGPALTWNDLVDSIPTYRRRLGERNGSASPDVDVAGAAGVGVAGTSIVAGASCPSCAVPVTAVAAGFSSTVTAVSLPDSVTRARSAAFISSVVTFSALVVVNTDSPDAFASFNACSLG